MDMHRRAMESLGEVDETVARDKPEWTTPNRVVVDLAALRLRDFSVAQEGRHPTLVVAPFALHDAALADLAPGHSLVETLLANGCSRLFLAEWKSATMETRLHTIDTQLAALNVAVDDIGPPVDLIGLCQGGWLSLVYAARLLFSLEAAA
jgi:poly(3-hydroxyalkanoate) synthetase